MWPKSQFDGIQFDFKIIYIYILSLNIVNRKREIITNFKEFI